MFDIKACYLIVFWLVITILKLSRAEFSDYVLMKDDDKYIFSKTRTSYAEAERECNAIGGEIVQISDDSDREFFWPSLLNFYLQNTSEVEIWRGGVFVCKENTNECWIASYKFRQAYGINNDESPLMYKSSNIDHNFIRDFNEWDLSSIRLFERATGNFTEIVRFCWTREADKVASTCSGNYNQNFQLYGGNQQTANTIMLYNVKVKNFNVTSRLNFSHVGQEIFDSPSRIYLPDISLFIGARSEIGQTAWVWNNETIVTDPKFLSLNISECQQMTWPLTYKYLHENGINLRAKPCNESGLAYSICKLKCSNSSQIISAFAQNDGNGGCRVTWNHNFTNQINDYKITLMNKTELLETYEFEQENSGKSNQNSSYTFDLSSYVNITNNTKFELQIQAFTSCGFNSSIFNVSGVCDPFVVESEMSTISTSTQANVASETSEQAYVVTSTFSQETQGVEETNVVNTIANPTLKTTDQTKLTTEVETAFTTRPATAYHIVTMETSEHSSTDGTTTLKTSDHSSPERTTTFIIISDPSNPLLLIAVISSAAIILLILCIIIGCCVYKKYRNKVWTKSATASVSATYIKNEPAILFDYNESNDLTQTEELVTSNSFTNKDQTQTENDISSIPISELEQRYLHECSIRFKSFQQQFQEIKRISSENSNEHSLGSLNVGRNRYKNILPYDNAIVTLPGNRYINASFIQGVPEYKRFIATQGPTKSTVDDFWEMIWTNDTAIIVMLCKCSENGKKKCEKYWPEGQSEIKSKNLTIQLISQKKILDIFIRKLKVYHTTKQEIRTVTQFQYTGWPDHGIPITTTSMAKLRRLINAMYETNYVGPIVVHCSAGAGRTGAFLAYDIVSEEVKKSTKVELMKVVLKMRENRMEMVQTSEQFIFVYKLIVEDYLLFNTELFSLDLAELVRESGSLHDRSSYEWMLLSNQCLTTQISLREDPLQKNLEVDKASHHQISVFVGEERFVMDAHIVKIPAFPNPLIVSAPPSYLESGKEELFWRMVKIKNVSNIINLEKKSLFDDALIRGDQSLMFGNFKIDITNSQNKSRRPLLKLIIKSPDSENPKEVTHQTLSLSNKGNPPSSLTVKIIWKEIESSMKQNPKSMTLIYSSDPSNQIGIFLAFGSLMDQYDSEGIVDVFRTCKDLQAYRPTFVSKQSLYQECYKYIQQYVQETATSYSNKIYENL